MTGLVLSVAETLDPVRRWFNGFTDHVRILAIQSPT